MSRPAQLEQQMNRVKEIQAEMLGEQPVTEGTQPTEPTEPVAPTIVNEPPVTVSKEDYDKLEQKYRTLQGMHAADGQRARADIASLQTTLQDLETRLIAAEKAQTTAKQEPSRYVTEADEAEYGDTLDMMRRAAKEEAEALVHKQRMADQERIERLEQMLGQLQTTVVPAVEGMTRSQEQQVKDNFWGTLDIQVPDWKAINDDAAFKGWLLAEDPVTGATRQQFLSQARNNYDAARVIAFFKEWKRLQAGGQKPAPKNTQDELAQLVSPGSSRGTNVTGQPEKKIWTSAEIGQFYKDVTIEKKYVNRPEERNKIERDIFLAQQEGRVR